MKRARDGGPLRGGASLPLLPAAPTRSRLPKESSSPRSVPRPVPSCPASLAPPSPPITPRCPITEERVGEPPSHPPPGDRPTVGHALLGLDTPVPVAQGALYVAPVSGAAPLCCCGPPS